MDLRRQQSGESSANKFLDLIADPFQAQVRRSCYSLFGPKLTLSLGTTKQYLRCCYLLFCSYRISIHRLLLLATPQLTHIRPSSQTCRREASPYTSWQEAIQLASCRDECQGAGACGQDRLGCCSLPPFHADDQEHILGGYNIWVGHLDTDRCHRRFTVLQAVE
jgi:hypothetical protein